MASAFQAHGSSAKPTKYAPIFTNRFFTGLWTQRNPLREAAVPYLYERFYGGARFDSLIDGSNVEITSKLTLQRRAGTSTYNNGRAWPRTTRFYSFRENVSANVQVIHVMADESGQIYDATGPSTHTLVFTGSGGAAATTFQNVGSTLFMSNGVNNKKWIPSGAAAGTWNFGIATPVTAPAISTANFKFWKATTVYTGNQDVIIDPNGNIQAVVEAIVDFKTGANQPTWNTSQGQTTNDFHVTWANCGPAANIPSWQPSTRYTRWQAVVDTNGALQISQGWETSQGGNPTWNAALGGGTTDNAVANFWINSGTASVSMGAYDWAYSYHCLDGHVSTASPLLTVGGGFVNAAFTLDITGAYSTDLQCDKIYIWRTVKGGSTLLKEAEINNNTAGGSFTYTDTNPDSVLNEFIQAPIANYNDPPPSGLYALTYHLNRIWGAVGNTVYYTRATDQSVAGISVQSFPPNNFFTFPAVVTRLWPSPIGLIVFTTSDVFVISGDTSASFFAYEWLHGVALLSYDAFDVNGSMPFIFTADRQVIAIDPGAGVVEVGFPIGDKLAAFDPTAVFLTWHIGGSGDKALYVSDGSTGWYRMTQTSAPEAGPGQVTWSPFATITGGIGAVQSLQVDAITGQRLLLIGSPGVGGLAGGLIRKRDTTVSADNGTAFAAYATIGSLVLAQPGELAELKFITADCANAGTRPTVGVLMDEVSGTFDTLTDFVNDPPMLATSTTVLGSRFYFSQSQDPAWCRHLQLKFAWPAEAAANELLTYTLYGAHWTEL